LGALSKRRKPELPNLTLEDVARQAGVSRSTVSRVVNNHPHISEAVRTRVLTVINETGYQPNAAARSLASHRSQTLGLVLPQTVSAFFTDPYFPHLLKGISEACNQHDYALAFFLITSKEDEKKIFNKVSNRSFLDGVLVQSGHHGDQQIIGQLFDAKIPQVILGRPFRADNVSYVNVDNVKGAYTAVSHLIRMGHKRICTITGPLESTVGLDRKEGYLKALSERGLPITDCLIAEGDFSEQGGYYAMQNLLRENPDAVFAASDVMAFGAMRAIQEVGRRIPDEISVVGFDDLPLSTIDEFKLSTVRQPVIETGVRAVEVLIDLIENGIDFPQHIILDTKFIVRSTCAGKFA
jgi:LacI family transcriptional regulator